jgi:hypothetical protein
MLKSKKSLYILVPLTIAIWGWVGYSIYDGLNPELPPIVKVDESRFRESEIAKEELPPLKEPEFDPFTGKTYKKKVEKTKRTTAGKKKQINWPKIEYQGSIKDANGKRTIAAVKINNQLLTLNMGKINDSLSLVKIAKDYVILRLNGTSQRFKKA